MKVRQYYYCCVIFIALATFELSPIAAEGKEIEVMVPMRDGVKLHTKAWIPGNGKYPVVLSRAYGPTFNGDKDAFLEAGYACVGQSTRGHAESEGEEGIGVRFFVDPEDGYDALTWITKQPWCDGNIAMIGKSYWGLTQLLVAPLQHPNLKAIIPQVMNADMWQYTYRANGAVTLAMAANGRAHDRLVERDWNYYLHLPLITLDQVAPSSTKGASKLWRDYISHSTFDEYWQAISIRGDGKDGKYAKIRIPVYLMGGWYDYYPGALFNSYQKLREVGATDEIRIVIGAVDHLLKVARGRDFGPDADMDYNALAIRWLDDVIRGKKTGVDKEPPIKIFVMGINQWRLENEWPLARTRFTRFYFHSADGSRIGKLNTTPPNEETPTVYLYDPEDPVPTRGGNHSYFRDDIPDTILDGVMDQRPIEDREDVLVFSTDSLPEDTEVTGPISVKLYAASSAKDTDFVARLIDVLPDGTALNVTEGIIRARYRESVWGMPRLLEPDKVYEYTLELLPTGIVFKKGHRIRVHLTSSSFPLWDRNLNTGNPIGMDRDMLVAKQTIYHNRTYPSHLVLPVIPSTKGAAGDADPRSGT